VPFEALRVPGVVEGVSRPSFVVILRVDEDLVVFAANSDVLGVPSFSVGMGNGIVFEIDTVEFKPGRICDSFVRTRVFSC